MAAAALALDGYYSKVEVPRPLPGHQRKEGFWARLILEGLSRRRRAAQELGIVYATPCGGLTAD